MIDGPLWVLLSSLFAPPLASPSSPLSSSSLVIYLPLLSSCSLLRCRLRSESEVILASVGESNGCAAETKKRKSKERREFDFWRVRLLPGGRTPGLSMFKKEGWLKKTGKRQGRIQVHDVAAEEGDSGMGTIDLCCRSMPPRMSCTIGTARFRRAGAPAPRAARRWLVPPLGQQRVRMVALAGFGALARARVGAFDLRHAPRRAAVVEQPRRERRRGQQDSQLPRQQ